MQVTVTLSDAEQEALRDFLPRVQVANVCLEGSALHHALLKVSPKSLPWSLRNGGMNAALQDKH